MNGVSLSIGAFLNGIAEQEKQERTKAVELSPQRVGARQKRLASQIDRRALGEIVELPEWLDELKQVEEMPWYFGLDKAPPEGMTGQELVRVIGTKGGLGSTDVVLGA